MLMPEDAVYLRILEDRSTELRTRKEEAEASEVDELQAQIEELEADYESIIAAAVLI